MKSQTPAKTRLIKKRSAPSPASNRKPPVASQKFEREPESEIRHSGQGGAWLAQALNHPKSKKQYYSLTHGFHSYPGRFHPDLARAVFSKVEPRTQGFRVFDPFMGGGTTLVEGMSHGLEVIGNDLNPIAVLVARERCRLRSPSQSQHVLEITERLLKVILEQAGVEKKIIPRTHVTWLKPHYAPHLFVELLRWIDAIDKLPADATQETLRIVFASVVFRFSNEALQIVGERKTPSIPKGVVSDWMLSKTEELLNQQTAFYRKVPRQTKPAVLFNKDIAEFDELPENSVDLILTSPSAPISYDYHAHHLLQLKWLQLPDHSLKTQDMGTHRRYSAKRWKQPFRETLFRLRKVLKSDGSFYLNIYDWLDREEPVDALSYVQKYAPSVGWELMGTASMRMPVFNQQKEFYEEKGKWEHLVHLKNSHAPRPFSKPS